MVISIKKRNFYMESNINTSVNESAKRAIFFDLDGTLADTISALTAALNDTFAPHRYPLITDEETLRCINYGSRELVRRAAPDTLTPSEVDALLIEYLEHYRAHTLDTREAYEGIPELIYLLKRRGYICAVITNKPHEMARALTESLFGGQFDLILGQQNELPAKPDPAMAQHALDALGIMKEEVIFVGDSLADVNFARNAGMRFVGAGCGFFGRISLQNAGAESVASRPLEILNYL